ncbi:MAG: S-layer homology domain-containing protein [Ruminiclostridium sp.]|nr:S-layer homology domain-containing protein [Ruminiclostridium sp.]
MRNFSKKFLSIILVLTVLAQLLCVSAFAAEETENEPVYKNLVVFGDSICLGFSTEDASMADSSTYDIERNLLRSVLSEDYQHCYPTQFAAKIGLSPFEGISYPGGTWDYKTETEWDDVYNFGICAAWSGDIKELLTNPYYIYWYASANYENGDTFILPEAYTGVRGIVDTAAEGYNVADSSTWQYKTGEDYEGQYEEYTIPAGVEIPVVVENNWWGSVSFDLNPIIYQKYFYVSETCLDENGNFIDTNHDNIVNDKDIIYYPMAEWWGMYFPNTEEFGDKLGNPIQNPQFTKYYYNLATTTVKNGDLIALALGNNDIYHSFMAYQQSSDSMLCQMVYYLSYALQMNCSVNDILTMLEGSMQQGQISGNTIAGQSNQTAVLAADSTESDDPAGEGSGFSALTSVEEIEALLSLYSSENVTAYLADTVEAYKANYVAIIQRVFELKQDTAEVVLVGHYNPFGMVNYLTMLSEAAQNGQLFEHLGGKYGSGALSTILQTFIGTPEQWGTINGMTEEELLNYVKKGRAELARFLQELSKLDMNDENVDQAVTQMLMDLTFPVSVLLVGDALADTYEEMNSFLQEMAEKYDVAYVDVSDAPSNSRYDPHPTEYGHTWIAERFYETVVPEITASISPVGTGQGEVTPLGNKEFRLHDDQTYRFTAKEGSKISAIFVDGKRLSKNEFASVYADGQYTFEKIMANHSITVQFDRDFDSVKKFSANILGSLAKYGVGEGMYKPGDIVSINAGALDGFEFAGWKAEGVKLADSASASTTFEMPENAVTIRATWKAVEDEPENTPPQQIIADDASYVLRFVTNGGTDIPDYTKMSGAVIDLNAFFTTREGYDFAGWYSDKGLTKKANFATLTKDISLYAKWVKKMVADIPFRDVSERDWFYGNVDYVYSKGLMNGTSGTQFSPNLTTTRGMVVSMLYRLESAPAVSGKCPFSDVMSGGYYEDAITWAAENGIVGGYSDGRFGPDDNITREQMAAILYRYAQYKGYDVSESADISKYTDSGVASVYAVNPLKWANAKGLITGTTATTIAPGGEATRAQAAAILHRFCENIK